MEGLRIAGEVHPLRAGEDLEGFNLRGSDDDAWIELARASADGVDLEHCAEVVDTEHAHRLGPQRTLDHHVLVESHAHVDAPAFTRRTPASAMLKVRGPAT